MVAADAAPQPPADQPPGRLRRWSRHLLDAILLRTWYVHPGAHLRVTVTGMHVYRLLDQAARPSIQRLHLRNLFSRGRRYFLRLDEDSIFSMTTTHKVPWYPRRRSTASAVLLVRIASIDDSHSWVIMRGRFRIAYLLDVFLWPTFMTSMLIYMRWSPALILVLIALLYGLSWIAHRYTAALEVHEMIFFIEKALEDYIPAPASALAAPGADIIVERDFPAVWDRFIESINDEDE
jgi:hypothetical protein